MGTITEIQMNQGVVIIFQKRTMWYVLVINNYAKYTGLEGLTVTFYESMGNIAKICDKVADSSQLKTIANVGSMEHK